MHLFRSAPCAPGPRLERRAAPLGAWKARGPGPRYAAGAEPSGAMADSGAVPRSVASRNAKVNDKPTGVMHIPEALWVDFPGEPNSIWRIRFVLENFDMQSLQCPEHWQQLRQQLLHAVRGALRELLREHRPLQMAVEGMKLCKTEGKEDWPQFLATVSLHCASSDKAAATVAGLRGARPRLAERIQELLEGIGLVKRLRVKQEVPADIELRGGLGEDVFVIAVPEGRITDLGLCEGYELQAVLCRSADGTSSVCEGAALRRGAAGEILAKLKGAVRLCFRSPFARLPRFSEKQLADRLGFGKVRELHFHRLVSELTVAWRDVVLRDAAELQRLRSAAGGGAVAEEVVLGAVRLGKGWKLRFPKSTHFLEPGDLDSLQLQHLPLVLEAGPPREVQQLSSKTLQLALRRAGIHWVQEAEMMILLELLQQDREEDEATWEEDLADVFVIDSAGDFKRISGPGVRLIHVFHITRKIQEKLRQKKSAFAMMRDMTLSHQEFANIMDSGGLNWLTQEQVATIYRSIAGEDQEDGISLNDWMSRFVWDPMQAASELENVLQVWERRLERRAQLLKRRGNEHKGKMLKPKSLSFWAFHGILTEMCVDWLSLPQQRLLFRSLDANRDGRIDTEELKRLAQRRGDIEMWRQELAETEALEDEDQLTESSVEVAPEAPDGQPPPDPADSDGEHPAEGDGDGHDAGDHGHGYNNDGHDDDYADDDDSDAGDDYADDVFSPPGAESSLPESALPEPLSPTSFYEDDFASQGAASPSGVDRSPFAESGAPSEASSGVEPEEPAEVEDDLDNSPVNALVKTGANTGEKLRAKAVGFNDDM